MYCTNCGTAVPEGTNFCPKCGAPVSSNATSCHSEQYVNRNNQQKYDDISHNTEVANAETNQEVQSQTPVAENREPTTTHNQSMYNDEQTKNKKMIIDCSVLSLIFGAVALYFDMIAIARRDFRGASLIALLAIPSTILGVVALKNSIQSKYVKGIVLSAIGLCHAVLTFYCIITILPFINY